MPVKPPISISDLRGYSRLAVDATLGVTDLVEAEHANILRLPFLRMPAPDARGASPGWSTATSAV